MIGAVKISNKEFNKIIKNSISYSQGFLDGADLSLLSFNKEFAGIIIDALKKYIDSKARISPESLHHIYEWNRVGDPSARLFEIDSRVTKKTISLYGKFLESQSISSTSSEPFVDKARIMENKIAIEIEPRGNVLSFESDGEQVFTVNSIYIANPGGDMVAGSFGKIVEEFFDLLSSGFLVKSGILSQIQYPKEFSVNFPKGAKGGGKTTGLDAGRKYMEIKGIDVS